MRISLRHMIRVNPRHGRMRQRVRRLRPVRPSHANEMWYRGRLLHIVQTLEAMVRQSHLLETLKPYVIASDRRTVGLDADVRPMVRAIIHRLESAVGGLTKQAHDLASIAVKQNLKGVDERLISSIKQSIHLDVSGMLAENFAVRSAMDRALTENVNLITSIPDQYLDRVREVVEENLTAGVRWEGLVDDIEHIGDVTRSRAKLIARDQTSKMNGAFNQARQESLGIESYEWQTAGDERVRDTHAANDGQIFRWDSPPEETGHPGEDIQCRCVAIPIVTLDEEAS